MKASSKQQLLERTKKKIPELHMVDVVSSDGEILQKDMYLVSARAFVKTYNGFKKRLACFLVDRAAVLKAYKLRPSKPKVPAGP